MNNMVFAFDIGTGSLGYAVRNGNEILEAKSLLLPDDFASTKEQRDRRRQYRTRIAHKKREEWLKNICREAGIEVLEGRKPGHVKEGILPQKGDPRLEREFAKKGDNTVYTSCLLRIMLLQGEKLEGWQIYKALHSAIQRRGYDSDVPWKRKAENDEKEEQETKESVGKFIDELKIITENNRRYMFPCYYDAYQMGLWNPKTNKLTFQLNYRAERARGYSAPREMVEKEFKALLEAAGIQYPKLKNKIDFIMHGPTGTPYASYYPEIRKEFGLKEGSNNDWNGALAQKIPRFDNRCVDSCALIPRYNVCRAADILAIQVTFLMKLINIRYLDKNYKEQQLTPEDIKCLFNLKNFEAVKIRKEFKNNPKCSEETVKKFKFTEKDKNSWKTWLEKNKNGIPVVNHDLIEAPKYSGRSRFSRPALRLLKELILSGMNPSQFYNKKIAGMNNTDPKKELVKEDLAFLLEMTDDWKKIYIPQMTLADQYFDFTGDVEVAVNKLINEQRNPIIRHRLGVFSRHIDNMSKKFGDPSKVIIEFVREDFMGPKAKAEYEKAMRENRKKRDDAKEKANELGISGATELTKLMLLKQQNYTCLYTGENLSEADIAYYDIDHAVPQRGKYNGSDSMYNKVVTKSDTNREKGDKTPYEFLREREEWLAFCERVKSNVTTLGKKKARLLTAEKPEEVDEKYMSLAETAWLARIARDIVCLKFGWQPGAKGEGQKVIIINGSLTAKVRRDYKLNSLLAGDETDPDKIEKKNRKDKRHHALDAMVLSYITPNKLLLPDGVNKEYFRGIIDNIVPQPIAYNKPALEQTIYAKRILPDGEFAVKRIPVTEIELKDIKNIIDPNIRRQFENFISVNPEVKDLKDFVTGLTQSLRGGSHVNKIALKIGEINEYENLSKNDGRGQYRKGAKHQGQFVYFDEKGKAKVRPVYVYESKFKVKKELIDKGYQIYDFFFADCLIEIQKDIDLGNRIIPSGNYRLGSLKTVGRAKINSKLDIFKNEIGLEHLFKAGFHRVK